MPPATPHSPSSCGRVQRELLRRVRPASTAPRPVRATCRPRTVLALAFGWSPPAANRPSSRIDLAADVVSRGDHLNTGVTGTKYLLPILSDHGCADLAYRVATQCRRLRVGLLGTRPAPPVVGGMARASRSRGTGSSAPRRLALRLPRRDLGRPRGATTQSVQALPAAGLDRPRAASTPCAARSPRTGAGLHRTRRLACHVPANSTATVYVPARSPDLVAESGVPAATASGVSYVGFENGYCDLPRRLRRVPLPLQRGGRQRGRGGHACPRRCRSRWARPRPSARSRRASIAPTSPRRLRTSSPPPERPRCRSATPAALRPDA